MIVDDIRFTMEYVEEITKNLGDILCKEDYYIDDGGCPHCQPHLPEGYAAIYIFVYGSETEYEFLKTLFLLGFKSFSQKRKSAD